MRELSECSKGNDGREGAKRSARLRADVFAEIE